jgi:uncharacterized protein (TIRG00374 family)
VKLWINLLLSVAVGGVCVYLAWPKPEDHAVILRSLETLRWGWLFAYVGTLAVVHFFRAWRWDYLLRPSGTRLPMAKLLPVSSVGFMAILALPARLGEFVRPYLVAERGGIRMSFALGTVAVERIVDGLLVSVFVFFTFLSLRGPGAPAWMMPTAWISLGGFAALTLFLAIGVLFPERSARFAVRVCLLDRLAPSAAARIEQTLIGVCNGFRALGDVRNLALFLVLSAIYWFANGFGMWLLAKGFALPLPLAAALATMGLTAIGITLPNSPGLVGQFHYFTLLGLSLYLPPAIVRGQGLAYTAVLHAVQLVWYVGVGCLSLLSSHASFTRVIRASQEAAESAEPAREMTA